MGQVYFMGSIHRYSVEPDNLSPLTAAANLFIKYLYIVSNYHVSIMYLPCKTQYDFSIFHFSLHIKFLKLTVNSKWATTDYITLKSEPFTLILNNTPLNWSWTSLKNSISSHFLFTLGSSSPINICHFVSNTNTNSSIKSQHNFIL